MKKQGGIVGVSDHGGWAVLVTVDGDGTLLDRRRVALVDEDLPKIPHHCECQGLPMDEAVALVERVRASAEKCAAIVLSEVARAEPGVAGIALRRCQELPPTVEECIRDYRAQNVADWIMYRKAMALAAENRGWRVFWFEAKKLTGSAVEMRQRVGPPWNADHRLAMAAAMAALSGD